MRIRNFIFKKINLCIWMAVFGIGLLSATRSFAGERFDFYDGVRGLGMGNSVVATVNDETALYLNPAALGRLRNYFLNIADPELDVGSETVPMIGANVMDSLGVQKTLDDCNKHPDKLFHQREQISPSFVVTNFGFGALAKYQTDAHFNSTTNTYYYDYTSDWAATMGFNFRMFDGILKLGANIRAVDRTESHRTDIPDTSTGLTGTTLINNSTVFSEGFGVGSDAGMILTIPVATLPTLAAVYHDIGHTAYDINHGSFYSTTNRPATTPDTLDVGFSFTPIIGRGVRLVFTGQLSDVLQHLEPTDVYQSPDIVRRIHGGIELNFDDVMFIRGGYNQGYWTAGFEMDIGNNQLQLASYGEEIGDVPLVGSGSTYTRVEDRRYVAKYAFRF